MFPPEAAEFHVMGNNLYAANRNDKLFRDQTDSLATYTIDSMELLPLWRQLVRMHSIPRASVLTRLGLCLLLADRGT